jgi:hypothetical protein
LSLPQLAFGDTSAEMCLLLAGVSWPASAEDAADVRTLAGGPKVCV